MAQGVTASIAVHLVPLVSVSSCCLSLQPKAFLPCRGDQSSCFPSGFHLSLATSLPCVAFSDRDRSLAFSPSRSSLSLALARRCSGLCAGAHLIWKVGTESSPICRSERRNVVSQSQDCAELDTSIHEVLLDCDFFWVGVLFTWPYLGFGASGMSPCTMCNMDAVASHPIALSLSRPWLVMCILS